MSKRGHAVGSCAVLVAHYAPQAAWTVTLSLATSSWWMVRSRFLLAVHERTREHARMAAIPCNRIAKVTQTWVYCSPGKGGGDDLMRSSVRVDLAWSTARPTSVRMATWQ
jgi:hypothetical protein